MRNFHIIFHSDCTNLYLYQQCIEVSFFQYPCQHLLSLVFFIPVILTVSEVVFHCGFWGIPLTVLCISLTVSECWRIDAFEPRCWRRLMRVPWTARRSNQSLLKEISPEYSLEGLMLKQKLWPPDTKNWLFGKDPDAEKDWGQEKGMTEDKMVGWQNWLDGHEFG